MNKSLPRDRSKIASEQRHPRSAHLHRLSVGDCVDLFVDEDQAVFEALQQARPALTKLIEAAEPGFVAGGRLIYLGSGTSGRLGALDASEAPPTFQTEPGRVVGIIAGGDAALRRSSEGLEDNPDGARQELESLKLTPNDTLIGITAGGTTPFVLGGLELARRLQPGLTTALVTCSPVENPHPAHLYILLNTGPELLTGSTRMKGGTATKMALNIISTTLMIRAGRVYQNLMVELRATNDKLRDRAARIISILTGLEREAAFELLDRANGDVKTAVVMQRFSMDRPAAEKLLNRHNRRLDLALGQN